MKFGDIVCPTCGKPVDNSTVVIKRANLKNEAVTEDYFAGEDEKLCRKEDNIFLKAFCKECNKKFVAMVFVEVKPVKYYSAEDRDQLVMVEG